MLDPPTWLPYFLDEEFHALGNSYGENPRGRRKIMRVPFR